MLLWAEAGRAGTSTAAIRMSAATAIAGITWKRLGGGPMTKLQSPARGWLVPVMRSRVGSWYRDRNIGKKWATVEVGRPGS